MLSIKNIINATVLILLCFFIFLMVRLSVPYFTFRYDVDFLLTKQKIIHIKHWRYAFYVHVFLSSITLIAGLFQFSNYILKSYKRLHRTMGYLYVITILCFAGPSGLIMAFYANGTIWAKISFIILSLLWMLFTALALISAKQQQFNAHKQWMMRSFALTLSAITLRLLAFILPSFVHLNAFDEYTLIAWLSWTVNLIIAESIIFIKMKKKV
ncbi:MAG: DUF2306 domain-containing protein [Bacteroidota bacterium]|nr:DUF2306 domain-containing protein [Bacteroidota bacterium]